MPYEDRLADYATVDERLVIFKETYPGGRLRPLNPERPYEIVTMPPYLRTLVNEETGEETTTSVTQTFVVVVAAALRDDEDKAPGVGMAWEPFPGTTPYTHNSELMNAETSAWGRAIVAALIADAKKGIATQDEIRNRQEERRPVRTDPASDARAQVAEIWEQVKEHRSGPPRDWMTAVLAGRVAATNAGVLNVRQAGKTFASVLDAEQQKAQDAINAEENKDDDGV